MVPGAALQPSEPETKGWQGRLGWGKHVEDGGAGRDLRVAVPGSC